MRQFYTLLKTPKVWKELYGNFHVLVWFVSVFLNERFFAELDIAYYSQ